MQPRSPTTAALPLLLLLLLLVGQGDPASARPSAQPSGPYRAFLPMARGGSIFSRPPNPLHLTVALDSSRKAGATISVAGGTLSATAADGSRFTLTVPKDALLADTPITLTPLASAGGLPSSIRFVAGVDLQPEGLRLYQAATLTIEPPAGQAIPVEREVTLASHANGRQAHRYPVQLSPRTPTFNLFHFSTYYAGDGIWIPEAAPYLPTYTEDQIQQLMDELMRAERQAQLLGQPGDPQFNEKLEFLLREYFAVAILPNLPAAESDCGTAERVIPQANSWSRMVELNGKGDIFAAENAAIRDTWVRSLEACWSEVTAPCMVKNSITEQQRVAAIARQAQLLGVGVDTYNPANVPACNCSNAAQIAQSWTATVDFSFRAQASGTPYGGNTEHVSVERAASVTANLLRTQSGRPAWSGLLSGTARRQDRVQVDDPGPPPRELWKSLTGSGGPLTVLRDGRPLKAEFGVEPGTCQYGLTERTRRKPPGFNRCG